MHKKLLAFLLCTVVSAFMAGDAFPQDEEDEIAPEAVEGEQPQPEAPKTVMNVEIRDNRLSVELADAEFGAVMNTIAQMGGFKVEVASEVFGRKLTTKFSNLELERGILRLLALTRDRNYLMRYDSSGALSKVEIYGATPVVSTPMPRTPVRGFQRSPAPVMAVPPVPSSGAARQTRLEQLRQRRLLLQQQRQPRPSAPAPTPIPQEDVEEEDPDE
jgi:hypothetical protein